MQVLFSWVLAHLMWVAIGIVPVGLIAFWLVLRPKGNRIGHRHLNNRGRIPVGQSIAFTVLLLALAFLAAFVLGVPTF